MQNVALSAEYCRLHNGEKQKSVRGAGTGWCKLFDTNRNPKLVRHVSLWVSVRRSTRCVLMAESSDVRAISVTPSSDFNMYDGTLSELNSIGRNRFPFVQLSSRDIQSRGWKEWRSRIVEAKKVEGVAI